MSSDYWKSVLETARTRLAELRARRDELDAEREEVNLEIVQVEQIVANLAPLIAPLTPATATHKSNVKLSGITLAEACRFVLQQSKSYMTPIEVRNAIGAHGYDLSQHNNALASIHGVLKRFAESGEAEAISHDVKGTMYRWKQTATNPPPKWMSDVTTAAGLAAAALEAMRRTDPPGAGAGALVKAAQNAGQIGSALPLLPPPARRHKTSAPEGDKERPAAPLPSRRKKEEG